MWILKTAILLFVSATIFGVIAGHFEIGPVLSTLGGMVVGMCSVLYGSCKWGPLS